MRICANCRCNLQYLRATGYSGIYNPGDDKEEIELCEPCFLEEDELITTSGTNVHPNVLLRYNRNLRYTN